MIMLCHLRNTHMISCFVLLSLLVVLKLQHSDEPNVKHAMRQADGTVEVRAARDVNAGEELFNQYRPEEEEEMPYHRFFTRYGFVPGVKESISLLKDKSSIFVAQSAEI